MTKKSIFQSFANTNRSIITLDHCGNAFVITNHIAGVPLEKYAVFTISPNRETVSLVKFATKAQAEEYVTNQVRDNDPNEIPF